MVPTTPVVLSQLTEDECWSLLANQRPAVGRIAFVDGHGSVIYPMNYAVADRTLYLRTAPTSRLTAATQSQHVAFEIDDVDDDWERGWSVLARGHLREVDDPDELEQRRELRLRTWAPGQRLHLLRLDVTQISGRRIA